MTNLKLDKRTIQWIKAKRGSGNGADYSPWLTVSDVPSQGRVHRVQGHLTQRTHHLLSDLEFSTFLLLEWNPLVVDIREQFPMDVEETTAIAKELGIRHPEISGHTHVMSSDFLVDMQESVMGPIKKVAIQVKPLEALMDSRTLEKLRIEQRYWEKQDVTWKIVTERDLPPIYIKNLIFLHPSARLTEPMEVLIAMIPEIHAHLSRYQSTRLPDIGMMIDQAYELSPGTTLSRIRALCALRIFQFDLHQTWESLTGSDLIISDIASVTKRLRYSHA